MLIGVAATAPATGIAERKPRVARPSKTRTAHTANPINLAATFVAATNCQRTPE